MRAGGPGGRRQNWTENAVRAIHLPTGAAAIARDGRSQHRNRALAALDRLACVLAAMARKDAVLRVRKDWLAKVEVKHGNARMTLRP